MKSKELNVQFVSDSTVFYTPIKSTKNKIHTHNSNSDIFKLQTYVK